MRTANFEDLPVIPLRGTEANDLTGYTPLQSALLDYIAYYHFFLWLCFFGTLFYLLFRYVRPALYAPQPAVHTGPAMPERQAPGWQGRIAARYKKLFHIDEIESDLALRLFGGAILLGFLVTFYKWESHTSSSIAAVLENRHLCWPFFQSCANLIFLDARPGGYAQNTLYMALFALIFLGAYGLLARRYALAHACILILFIFKIYATLLNYTYNANYDYYHTGFCIVFLFLAHKRFFGSVCVIFFYFLSTATKIHETWTLGTYFTSMQTGLPLFPESTTPLWTNLVILMEMIGTWFLLSRNRYLQRGAFFFFVCFHLYSGILVGYHYPAIVMPALIIFFGPLYRPVGHIPTDRASFKGWALLFALFCLQMISHLIPGDEKLTMEGNFYGLYMFEANHQCLVRIKSADGKVNHEISTVNARNRCDPYATMFQAQNSFCGDGDAQRHLSLSIGHSINGGPFYRIVHEPDLCSLTYKPFGKNDWIKTEKTAPAMARPRKNIYY